MPNTTDAEQYGAAGLSSAAPGPGDEQGMQPSRLAHDNAFVVFKNWFRADARHSQNWRKDAKEDFDFVTPGGQWKEEDKAQLKGQRRVPIEFNRTLTIVKAIAGMEINGRHEISYLPRKLEDAAIDEVLTGASKWMADECDGEDEESDAFQNAAICGLGVVEHTMDYEEEPEGKYVENSINPLEVWWDRTAHKKNLIDARRIWHVKTMPLGDGMQLFPGFDRGLLDAKWALGNEPQEPKKTLEERRIRDENSSGPVADLDEITIVRLQWWEREICWCVADEQNNKLVKVTDEVYRTLQSRHADVQNVMSSADPTYQPQPLSAVKVYRRVYKQAFIGNTILEMTDGPLPDRFSFTFLTGQLRHNERTWFGVVRLLRDPQQWGNKWLTQTLHILNSTAKGGIVAETDFFEDQRQAEDTWARPDAITWARRGALSGQHGPKFVAKPGQGSFEGYIDLLDLAINATRDVSGINLELLGQKDINQPGILEAMRKQAGMTVLATMFDALRRMRKIIGRIRLFYIQNYLSDGRIIRIIGQDGKKSMRLLRDRTLGEYDVIVDDTPTSPNQKQANWGIISTLLPLFKDQLMARPDVLIKLLEYSPLPTALIEAVRQTMAGPTPQSPIQQQMQQLQLSAATAKISKDQAQAELFMKQAGATETTAMYDMAMAQNLMLKHRNDLVAALNEARASGIESAKQAAQTDHFSAKADVERARAAQIRTQTVGDEANIHHTNARTDMAHAQAHRERVGALIDALTPIPHEPPVQGDAGNGQQAPVLQTP